MRRSILTTLIALALPGSSGCKSAAPSSTERPTMLSPGQPLTPDDNGRVQRSTTGTTGIQGRWVARADSEGCRKDGKHARRDCSMLLSPDPAAPSFPPAGDLGMCALGVVAGVTVGRDGRMDYAHVWGVSLDFDLDPEDGRPYDAPAHGVTGFAFHIDAEPPPGAGLRVRLKTAELRDDPPFWNGGSSEVSPVHAGHNEFRWAEVGGPIWVDNPPRFDSTRLLGVWFQVPAVPGDARSFSFCIRDLVALRD